METAGEFLRARREQSGKSLEEISRKIHIRQEVLRNLEVDLFNFAPAEVYVIGALTAYARALGLDPAEVLERYHAGSAPATDAAGAEAKVEERRSPARRWVLAASAVAALALVVVVLGRRTPPEREAEVRPVEVFETAAPETLPAAPAARVRQPDAARVILEMSVEESTWVGLEMDGERRYSALLPPGAWRRWEADSAFSVKIGNAGGVTLTLDGEPVDFPRVRGGVVVLDLPGKEHLGRSSGGYARPSPDDSTGGGDL